ATTKTRRHKENQLLLRAFVSSWPRHIHAERPLIGSRSRAVSAPKCEVPRHERHGECEDRRHSTFPESSHKPAADTASHPHHQVARFRQRLFRFADLAETLGRVDPAISASRPARASRGIWSTI